MLQELHLPNHRGGLHRPAVQGKQSSPWLANGLHWAGHLVREQGAVGKAAPDRNAADLDALDRGPVDALHRSVPGHRLLRGLPPREGGPDPLGGTVQHLVGFSNALDVFTLPDGCLPIRVNQGQS